MTSILLVRHAHSAWSRDEMRPLSEEGAAAAGRLADELAVLPIAAVYSSPYRRSLETVGPLAGRIGVPVEAIAGLRERALGRFDSPCFDDAVARGWTDFDLAHPEGESNRAAQRRGLDAIRLLVTRHPDDLVVAGTHGTLLALILHGFDARVGFDFWRTLQQPDVVRLDLGPFERVAHSRVPLRRPDGRGAQPEGPPRGSVCAAGSSGLRRK